MANNITNVWKLMGIDPATGTGTYKNRMGLGNAITRDNGIPLDLSTLHATYNDAVVYAATSSIAYVDQPIAAEGVLYLITEESQGKVKISSYRDSITGKLVTGEETEYDVYLKRVGIVPTGDNASIVVSGEGLIKLFAFDGAQAGAVPVKEDGKLVWKTLEEIGAGDGNDNTTYEFEVCEHGVGLVITPLFNGQPIMEGEGEEATQVKYHLDLDAYTKSEVDAAIKVIADKVGVPAEGDASTATLYERIAAEITRATNAESALSERIGVAKDGDAAATGVYAYVDGVVNALVNGVDPEKIDSLNELIAWVEEHPAIVEELDGRLDKVEGILDGIGDTEAGEKATVKAYVDDAFTAHTEAADGKYATKQEITDAGYAVATDVERDYAKKATTLEGYGITDAYTKNEVDTKIGTPGVPAVGKEGEDDYVAPVDGTGIFANAYSKAEVNALLDQVSGGSSETAASVKRQLDEYKTSNNERVASLEDKVGKDVNGEEPATGLFLEVDQARAVADEAKAASVTNANEIAALTGQLANTNTNVSSNTTEIGKINTEITTGIKPRLESLEGADEVIEGTLAEHTAAIKTINETTIPALQGTVNSKAAQTDVDAINQKIGTVEEGKTVVDMINSVAGTIDFTPYAKTEEVANTYATIAALNTEKGRIDILVGEDSGKSARFIATEEIAKVVNSAPEDFDTLKEIADYIASDKTNAATINNKLAAHDSALAGIGGEGEPTTVLGAIAAAAYVLPAATVDALGGIKSAADVDGKVAENKVYVDADGNAEVKAFSTDKLVQGTMTLVLNGGDAQVTA